MVDFVIAYFGMNRSAVVVVVVVVVVGMFRSGALKYRVRAVLHRRL